MENWSKRDTSAFQGVQRLYEEKDYEKAAKQLDVLLKRLPQSEECLALKCLVLRNLPNGRDEALAAGKAAVAANLKSHVAWHALATFYRLERDYPAALQAMKKAVSVAGGSHGGPSGYMGQKLKGDLSSLQIHMGNFGQLVKTRQTLLQERNDIKVNWYAIPFALALTGEYNEAAERLLHWWELPECAMSHVRCPLDPHLRLFLSFLFEQSNQPERALAHVTEPGFGAAFTTDGSQNSNSLNAADQVSLARLQLRGRLELRLGRFADAQNTYLALLKLLPQNADYVLAYFLSHPEFHRHIMPLPFAYTANETDGSRGDGSSEPATASTIRLPQARLYPDILTGEGVKSSEYMREPLELFVPQLFEAEGRLPISHKNVSLGSESLWLICHQLNGVGKLGTRTAPAEAEADASASASAPTNAKAIPVSSIFDSVSEGLTAEKEKVVMDIYERLVEALENVRGGQSLAVRSFPIAFMSSPLNLRRRCEALLTPKWRQSSVGVLKMVETLACARNESRRKVLREIIDKWCEEARAMKEPVRLALALASLAVLRSKSLTFTSTPPICRSPDIDKAIVESIAESIALLEEAIALVPTLSDLHLMRADLLILQTGVSEGAAKVLDKVRRWDLSDRYLNDVCIRHHLEAGEIEKAFFVLGEFNKNISGVAKTPEVADVQNFTLELNLGRAYWNEGLLAQTYRRFLSIHARYGLIADDDFDFYNYSLRKATLLPLFEYIKTNRKIFAHNRAVNASTKLLSLILFRLRHGPWLRIASADGHSEDLCADCGDPVEVTAPADAVIGRRSEWMSNGLNSGSTTATATDDKSNTSCQSQTSDGSQGTYEGHIAKGSRSKEDEFSCKKEQEAKKILIFNHSRCRTLKPFFDKPLKPIDDEPLWTKSTDKLIKEAKEIMQDVSSACVDTLGSLRLHQKSYEFYATPRSVIFRTVISRPVSKADPEMNGDESEKHGEGQKIARGSDACLPWNEDALTAAIARLIYLTTSCTFSPASPNPQRPSQSGEKAGEAETEAEAEAEAWGKNVVDGKGLEGKGAEVEGLRMRFYHTKLFPYLCHFLALGSLDSKPRTDPSHAKPTHDFIRLTARQASLIRGRVEAIVGDWRAFFVAGFDHILASVVAARSPHIAKRIAVLYRTVRLLRDLGLGREAEVQMARLEEAEQGLQDLLSLSTKRRLRYEKALLNFSSKWHADAGAVGA